MTNFYISDLHFGHDAIISFDNRPFMDAYENDYYIINNWNNAVGYDDDVYLLGDISWYGSTKTIEIFDKLNGNIHLIRGNHDNKVLKNPKLRERFCEITDYKELTDSKGNGLVLCHYPLIAFKNHYYNWWHFYGHVHNTWEYDLVERSRLDSIRSSRSPLNMVNVGCMMPWIGYTPRTFDEIVKGVTEFNSNEEV